VIVDVTSPPAVAYSLYRLHEAARIGMAVSGLDVRGEHPIWTRNSR